MFARGGRSRRLQELAEYASQAGFAMAADMQDPSEEEGSGEGLPDGGGTGNETGPVQDDNGQGLDTVQGEEKLTAMAAVAKTIKPGCEHWDVKDKTFPKENKPNAEALRAEVIRRDSTKRPAGWGIPKLCQWLHSHGPPPGETGGEDGWW